MRRVIQILMRLFFRSGFQVEVRSLAASTLPCGTGFAAFIACVPLAFAGCAGGQGGPTPPDQSVAIVSQPASQIVPVGQTATFTVSATGSAPISFQWSENGSPIQGATSASYTTPAVALGANGSTSIGSFQVTASNSVGSATSNAATLAVGARSPEPGDLRYLLFEQVSLSGMMESGTGNLLYYSDWSYSNAIGTPLWLGSVVTDGGGPCSWHFQYDALPPPMNNLSMYYNQGFLNETTVAAYLQSVAAPNVVITSMDIEMGCPSGPAYPGGPEIGPEIGVSWVQTSRDGQGTFDQRLEVVTPAQVPTQVAADGQASRIVTAASFDANGNANLLSYGWTGDTTTIYETQTYLVPPAQVASTATSLAAAGYFISAFGGNDASGWILVGERVKGDTLPRPLNINGTVAPNPDSSAYFTEVVILNDSGGSAAAAEQ